MGKSEVETKRVVFFVGDKDNFFEEKVFSFTWYMGMNYEQRCKSSKSLNDAIHKEYPDRKILEASTKSYKPEDFKLGKQLSAFNLCLDDIPIENIFQSSKVFNDGGPYRDLLHVSPREAKGDERIKIDKSNPNRRLVNFNFNNEIFELEPKSMFYDFIYIKALSMRKDLSKQVCQYDVFTDIEFNQKIPYSQKKGPFNCQARSLAIFVSLNRKHMLNQYLEDYKAFADVIYPKQKDVQPFLPL